MERRGFGLEIFLVSFSLLLLEVSYTRIFSFKASSHFTYLIIGFALLGIGAGGVFVAVLPRMRALAMERLLPALALAGGIVAGVGYFVIAPVELASYAFPPAPGEVLPLLLVCAVLFLSFLSVGLIISGLFAARPESIPRLYGADLAGAGLGCAAAVPLMLWISPPGCVFASGALLALAGLRLSILERQTPMAVAALLASAGLSMGAVFAELLPDPVVDPSKTLSRQTLERWDLRPVFRRWHPVFRVDVLEGGPLPDMMALIHDGMGGSQLHRYDRSPGSLDFMDASSRRFPFAVSRSEPRVLLIGSAGGGEILASLRFGASHITAVELNPVTISILKEDFADYTGHLPEHEKVTMVNAEGRSFLQRDASKYDLIYFGAPDSYAAMNAAQASSFVMAESYLYTKEMIQESFRHLDEGGILCMQFGEFSYEGKPNRTSRYLATARSALAELGIHDFDRHVILATTHDFPLDSSTILLQATPFRPEQIASVRRAATFVPTSVVRHAGDVVREEGVPNQVIVLPDAELERFHAEHPYDIRPISDDRPFFWHFARFSDLVGGALFQKRTIDPEGGMGEAAILVMLLVATGFAGVFLLLPFVLIGERWRALPGKPRAILYFGALGLGFMFFEIAMLQKLTLFLGYPTYSLSVTLFSLLVFSGLGSLAAERHLRELDRALPLLIGVLAALMLFYQFGLDRLVAVRVGSPLAVRVLFALGALLPLGLCLGAFMPVGLRTVAGLTAYRAEYVAWAWGVNGFFSVIGSILATVISMSLGFRVLLLVALGVYVTAGFALQRLRSVGPS